MQRAPAEQDAYLLDVSRLVSRVGRGRMTGIDRVERAYLRELLSRPGPVFGLARGAPGQVLLDRIGLEALAARIDGAAKWGEADWLSRLHLRQNVARRRAMSDLRRISLAWAPERRLGRLLLRHVPPGTVYLNAGHSNLNPGVMAGLRMITGLRAVVLVHDTIPLDHPEFTRPRAAKAFEQRLRIVAQEADLAIYNSEATARSAGRHFAAWGRVPPGLVAHLGVDAPCPDRAALAPHWPPLGADRPVFVSLGTIEPRKNHALLLDVWDELARETPSAEMPALCIAGGRGWRNEEVFARLDRPSTGGGHVFELPDLDDGAVAALLDRAHALLFPSHAEGFGLPAAEAASLGIPVICSDLPVFREFLGEYPVYANTADRYLWKETIVSLARRGRREARRPPPMLPTWEAHFSRVLGEVRRGLAPGSRGNGDEIGHH